MEESHCLSELPYRNRIWGWTDAKYFIFSTIAERHISILTTIMKQVGAGQLACLS
jgi:hypothetical protein